MRQALIEHYRQMIRSLDGMVDRGMISPRSRERLIADYEGLIAALEGEGR